MTIEEPKLWRFRPVVDAVLITLADGTLWCLPIKGHRFHVLRTTTHPSGQPCLEGEIYGGESDGTRFFCEPEWEPIWPVIAEDA